MIHHFYGSFVNVAVFWTSIDLLFTLSGLLITGILIETKEDSAYFKKFYMRRLLRIFPLYYLLLSLFAIFIFFISSHPDNYSYFKTNILYFLTYTQNWYFINNGMPQAGHLNHTWSLAIDEQIYLVWPLLIWLCKSKKQLIYLCIGTILFSLLYRFGYNIYIDINGSPHPFPYFHNTFCRLDAFAAGGLLYCFLRFKREWLTKRKVFIVFFTSAILFIACGIADNSFERAGYFMRNFGCTLAGINYATWFYFGINKNNKWLTYILSSKWLVYTGKISYSLYVFHSFLLILLVSKIGVIVTDLTGIRSLLPTYIICFGITFIVSILSYEYFEKPFMNLKRRFSYKLNAVEQPKN